MAIISNGTTILDAGAFSASLGSMVLIKTLTASSSATLSFVDGTSSVVLDNTYPIYLFKFINIHGATDDKKFEFQANAAGGSGFNETMTTTSFVAYHDESNSTTALEYNTGGDQAQATGFQMLNVSGGFDIENSANLSGTLTLFNPSSTTFVKHFISNTAHMGNGDYSHNNFVSGYFNTTAAIDEIQFKMSSGNIDAGDICLYGIS